MREPRQHQAQVVVVVVLLLLVEYLLLEPDCLRQLRDHL
jgi:hypothetical protein